MIKGVSKTSHRFHQTCARDVHSGSQDYCNGTAYTVSRKNVIYIAEEMCKTSPNTHSLDALLPTCQQHEKPQDIVNSRHTFACLKWAEWLEPNK